MSEEDNKTEPTKPEEATGAAPTGAEDATSAPDPAENHDKPQAPARPRPSARPKAAKAESAPEGGKVLGENETDADENLENARRDAMKNNSDAQKA